MTDAPDPLAAAWREFSRRLERFVAKSAAAREDVEDVVQEVFLRLVRRPPRDFDAARLRAWLWRAARRVLIDRAKRRGLPETAAPVDVAAAEAPAEKDDPAVALARCLATMRRELPDDDRVALERADMEGERLSDLARSLGLSESGAKSRVVRARRKLRDVLKRCCAVERDRLGGVADVAPRSRRGACAGAC
jgi:RNA polymerase sigma-70 factor, ECF subfamily